MYALVTFSDYHAHAQQQGPLRRPVSRRPRPIFLARKNHQRHIFFFVSHRHIVDRHLLAARLMQRPSAFRSRCQLIPQPDISKRSAHHHFMISSPRAVGIKFRSLHTLRDQIFPRRTIHRNRTRRPQKCDPSSTLIAQHRKRPRIVHVRQRRRNLRHLLEKWRQLDVCGLRVPNIEIAARHLQIFSSSHRPQKSFPYSLACHCSSNRAHCLFDFFRRRPNLLQENRLARRNPSPAALLSNPYPFFPPAHKPPPAAARPDNLGAPADEFFPQNFGSRSGTGHRRQIIFFNRLSNRLRQRPAVPDARCASKPH